MWPIFQSLGEISVGLAFIFATLISVSGVVVGVIKATEDGPKARFIFTAVICYVTFWDLCPAAPIAAVIIVVVNIVLFCTLGLILAIDDAFTINWHRAITNFAIMGSTFWRATPIAFTYILSIDTLSVAVTAVFGAVVDWRSRWPIVQILWDISVELVFIFATVMSVVYAYDRGSKPRVLLFGFTTVISFSSFWKLCPAAPIADVVIVVICVTVCIEALADNTMRWQGRFIFLVCLVFTLWRAVPGFIYILSVDPFISMVITSTFGAVKSVFGIVISVFGTVMFVFNTVISAFGVGILGTLTFVLRTVKFIFSVVMNAFSKVVAVFGTVKAVFSTAIADFITFMSKISTAIADFIMFIWKRRYDIFDALIIDFTTDTVKSVLKTVILGIIGIIFARR